MSSPLLSVDFRVGAPGASYDILRVTTDPRVAGLTADLGTFVEYIGSQGSVMLVKYTTWDTGWRLPGEGPVYPATSASFLGATKLTPNALYIMDQMTGDVFDASGNGNTLTVNGTPTFQRSLENKVGVYYGGVADAHNAAVNDPAANSFIWGCEGTLISGVGTLDGFVGRCEGAAFGFTFYWNTLALHILLKDAAGNILQTDLVSTPLISATPAVPYLFTGQIDKSTNRFRARMSRNGVAVATVDVSAAALGTFTKAAQKFGFGAIPSGAAVFSGGAWVPYSYYATGVQCEGANVLRDLHVGLGWEI